MDERLRASKGHQLSEGSDTRRIVVVGPCAAGKSTLVEALQALGYDAHVSGQEHSAIASLWEHLEPEVLIVLNVDIAAVRHRRGAEWPEWLHDLQVRRLKSAAEAADFTVDTTVLDPETLAARVVAFLEGRDGLASMNSVAFPPGAKDTWLPSRKHPEGR